MLIVSVVVPTWASFTVTGTVAAGLDVVGVLVAVGVAGVDAIGGYTAQFHVRPYPEKLVAFGLGFHDVIEALEKNNASIGAGHIENNGEAYIVRSDGRIGDASEIGNIVVANRKGTPVYLKDIADIGFGKELRTHASTASALQESASWVNGDQDVAVYLMGPPDAARVHVIYRQRELKDGSTL